MLKASITLPCRPRAQWFQVLTFLSRLRNLADQEIKIYFYLATAWLLVLLPVVKYIS